MPVVPLLTEEARLKRAVRQHLFAAGFIKGEEGALSRSNKGKDTIRAMHAAQRRNILDKNKQFIIERLPVLKGFFLDGSRLKIGDMDLRLRRVSAGTDNADIFRLASMLWSVPVSNGFGRRLRYLVWDEGHNALAGLIALGDPVFNLSTRDRFIGWSSEDRRARLVNMMDAYVLGAVPPYSMILGGKVIACMIQSEDVYCDFAASYADAKGIISGKKKSARLLAITTSSSMGRSSVYNRLKVDGHKYMQSLGYTSGWGHFHIPDDLFAALRSFLRSRNHPYADQHRFGNGPSWRFRTIRAALSQLGLDEAILKHGIKREVFISFLATNSLEVLNGQVLEPDISDLMPADQVAKIGIARWMTARAQNDPSFQAWNPARLDELLQAEPEVSLSARLFS